MTCMDMELELADRMTVDEVVSVLKWVLNEEQLEEVAGELCAFQRRFDEFEGL